MSLAKPPNRKPEFELVFAELRERVTSSMHPSKNPVELGELAQALHELDVCYAELAMQNDELRTTQLSLMAARDQYRGLFDNAPVAVLALTVAGVIREANRSASQLLGRSADRLAGKPLTAFLAEAESPKLFNLMSSGATAPAVAELKIKVGDDAHLVRIQAERLTAGVEPIWLCHLVDIDAQHAAEVAKADLERRLHEAEKLEAIGRVAANIAHDVNNMLVSIISISEFMKGDAPPGSALERDLTSVLEASWRGARLMRGLLGLAKASHGKRESVDVVALISRFVATQQRIKAGVVVTASLPDSAVRVVAAEDELFHVLANLGSNAIDAMESGTVRFSCELREGAALPVRIKVEDTGVGMSPAAVAKAFEPLFTTKSERGGCGLGLTIVYKTVTSLEGTVVIDSVVGQGTTVTIDLPVDSRALPAEPQRTEPAARLRKILLVDDDAQVVRATKRLLESSGASVTTFADGFDALEALGPAFEFDAAIIDVNMPRMSGPSFVHDLFERYGPVPVIFVTGASGDIVPQKLLELAWVSLLRKPWTRTELLDAIDAVANTPRGDVHALHA